jgi:hypothetical protein
VREALRMEEADRPPAVDFVAKQEKLEGLLAHVREAFKKRVHLRWDLELDWQAVDIYSLVNRFEADLQNESILGRAEELGDLFRLLFKEVDQARVDRLLWQDQQRAALAVYTYSGGFPSQPFVVVCGTRKEIMAERENYLAIAPEAPGDNGSLLRGQAQTSHYAANAYALAGADMENLRPLAEAYLTLPEKDTHACLRSLFQETLPGWQQSQRVIDENDSLAGRYRRLVAQSIELPSHLRLEEHIHSIALHGRAAGIDLKLEEDGLSFQVGRQRQAYPPPLQALESQAFEQPGVVLARTPGNLSWLSILGAPAANPGGAPTGQAWLSDFRWAGWAPVAWSYVLMEAELRFDRLETSNMQQIYAVEKALLSEDFTQPDPRDLDPPLRKPFRAILEIRKLAAGAVGRDVAAYHLGVYYQALKRVAEATPSAQAKKSEQRRLAHAVVCLAMASQVLSGGRASPSVEEQAPSATRSPGIQIDLPSRQVWVDGEPVVLSKTDFELLAYFYQRANLLCTREEVFRLIYDRSYSKADAYLLDTAIDRLRDKIEPERGRPRYLITRPREGYILKKE